MSTDKHDNDVVKSKPIELEVSNSPNVDKLGEHMQLEEEKLQFQGSKYGKTR